MKPLHPTPYYVLVIYLSLVSFFHWQPAEPQRPASFGSEEDFPVDSILATMLKEDKSEEDKQNGRFSKSFLAFVNTINPLHPQRDRNYVIFLLLLLILKCVSKKITYKNLPEVWENTMSVNNMIETVFETTGDYSTGQR